MTANIPAFLIRSLIATLNDLGYATSRLTVGLGVSLEDLADPACRISFRQAAKSCCARCGWRKGTRSDWRPASGKR